MGEVNLSTSAINIGNFFFLYAHSEVAVMLLAEVGMADFIMERVTPEVISELKDIVAGKPDLPSSYQLQFHHEVNFHGKLYKAREMTH